MFERFMVNRSKNSDYKTFFSPQTIFLTFKLKLVSRTILSPPLDLAVTEGFEVFGQEYGRYVLTPFAMKMPCCCNVKICPSNTVTSALITPDTLKIMGYCDQCRIIVEANEGIVTSAPHGPEKNMVRGDPYV
jgi:hypothetical protein